ncbi:MAG: malonyl-ACP O-methyltransferase BioC [Oceanospirillaceae bacterium]|nr:malonyl-ACP O-methyltransferase BioC [Oceanospirillaceae bacterium]MCP5334620.1 malonyl-ACP O-methyltransferase BioC [Oceanospirillaceae bacterium]
MISRQDVARAFSQAAGQYDAYALIQQRLATRLLASLPAGSPEQVLDLGCGTGYCLPSLQQHYPCAHINALDIAPGMLAFAAERYGDQFTWLCADAEQTPLADNSMDLVFSNLAVQWCASFSAMLAEIKRILRPGGQFIFTTLAEGTLAELRQAWAEVDDTIHVHSFPTEQVLVMQARDSGLRLNDVQCFDDIAWYQDVRALSDSLKRVGAHNMQHQHGGLGGRARLKAWMQAMESFRTPAGLPARYRVVQFQLEKVSG